MTPLTRLASATLVLFALLNAASAASEEYVVTRSARSFDDTVQQLQWAFGGYGLTTVVALDYQQILKDRKPHNGRAVMFEVMRREWLKTLLSEDPSLGILMPVRIYVFESENATIHVSYQGAATALRSHTNERVRAFATQLYEKVDALVAQATKAPPRNQ